MDCLHRYCFGVSLWSKSSFEDSFEYVFIQQPVMVELSKVSHIRDVVLGGGKSTPRIDFRKRLENKI